MPTFLKVLLSLATEVVCVVAFWRRAGVPVVSLPPNQGDASGTVWPPPPRRGLRNALG